MSAKTPLRVYALLLGAPLLIDMLLVMGLFSMTLELTAQKVLDWRLGMIGTLNAVGYASSALWAGRIVTPRRAEWLIIAASLTAAGVGAVACLTSNLWACLALSLAFGVVGGMYFAPFQVRVGHFRPFKTLAYTVGFYNISWGTGLSFGPFVASLLSEYRPFGPMLAMGTVALLHLGLCLANRSRADAALGDDSPAPVPGGEGAEQGDSNRDFVSTPAQRRAGWVGVLMASLLLASFTPLWTSLSRERGLSNVEIGAGALAIGIQIPLLAMFWPLFRRRMNGRGLLVALMLLAGVSFLLMPGFRWPMSLLPIAGAGVAISGLFFHSVYYSNADVLTHGRSVGMNEVMVGIGAIIGPVFLQWLTFGQPSSWRPYIAVAIISVLAAGTITWIVRRGSPRQ